MFGVFSKTREARIFPFSVDMHSHLLPGVDDGSPNVEVSMHLIGELEGLGLKTLVTTPHIYHELYPNSVSTLTPAYEKLREVLSASDISLRFAAEYFLDDHVDSLLKQGDPLLTIHDNWILVETSFVQPPPDLDRRVFDLQVAGYKPIMAHPERYPYWHNDRTKFHELREKGLLLQVNLLSLTGYYGKGVMDAAKYLVKEGLVDLVGTDCHHERHVAALQKGSGDIVRMLDPLIRKDKLLNNAIF